MQITLSCVCMESLLCGVSADNEFGCSAPRWKCPSSFSTFSSAKCLEILEMSQNVWKCWEMFPALKWGKEDHYLIFVPKLVAATTKPPQKGVKRENPFSVQTLSTASQKIQKYSCTEIQKLLSTDSVNCFTENTNKSTLP